MLVLFGTTFLFYLKFFYPDNKDTALHRLKILLFDENNIVVMAAENEIDERAIKVTWSSDFVKSKVIWKNGKKVGAVDNEYGPQGFEVFYYNKLIGGVSHMKTNNWHTHSYKIELHYLDTNKTIGFDFTAVGPNRKTEKNIGMK
ncbi:hypothetical protein OAK35_03795 [Crocinitomicaceae bacterium]|nr:hypothetical protein [Crocinitomicaceae bacterium]